MNKTIKHKGKLTPQVKEKLKDLLSQTGNLEASAAECGVTARAVYYAMDRDPELKEEISQARERACMQIEKEMYRRGITGISKGVYYQGERVDEEKEYSDKLLLALAKANMPHRFAERSYQFVQNNLEVSSGAKEKLAEMLGVNVIEGEIVEKSQSRGDDDEL